MMRSQSVLYMSQPSIVVTLDIMHERQSTNRKEEKKQNVNANLQSMYEVEGAEKGRRKIAYRNNPVGGPIHSPNRPHRSPKAKASETGIAI
jgi:hypothetical protein